MLHTVLGIVLQLKMVRKICGALRVGQGWELEAPAVQAQENQHAHNMGCFDLRHPRAPFGRVDARPEYLLWGYHLVAIV